MVVVTSITLSLFESFLLLEAAFSTPMSYCSAILFLSLKYTATVYISTLVSLIHLHSVYAEGGFYITALCGCRKW